jgi:hypothetical protein
MTADDSRYHGAYDARPLEIAGVRALARESQEQPWKPDVVAGVHARLYGPEIRPRVEEYRALRDELEFLDEIEEEAREGLLDEFKFRGRRYDAREAKRVAAAVRRRFDGERDWLAALDRKVFLVHYQMAVELGPRLAEDLVARYEFHLPLYPIRRELARRLRDVEENDLLADGVGDLDADDFHEVRTCLRDAHGALERCLVKAENFTLPALDDEVAGQNLRDALLEGRLIEGLRPMASSLPTRWIDVFLRQLTRARKAARRIHDKSLDALLSLQDRLAVRWQAELADAPAADVVEEAPPASTGVAKDDKKDPWTPGAGVAPTPADDGIPELAGDDYEVNETNVTTGTDVKPPPAPECDLEIEEPDPDAAARRHRHWRL